MVELHTLLMPQLALVAVDLEIMVVAEPIREMVAVTEETTYLTVAAVALADILEMATVKLVVQVVQVLEQETLAVEAVEAVSVF